MIANYTAFPPVVAELERLCKLGTVPNSHTPPVTPLKGAAPEQAAAEREALARANA